MDRGITLIGCVLLVAVLFQGATAADYVVGDNLGWTIPVADTSAYSNWAASKSFKAGDTLVFNFTTGEHDVAEVSKADYESCSTSNLISNITSGPANITVESGTHYYICSFGKHCSAGQKVIITTTTTTTTTSPPPPSTSSSLSLDSFFSLSVLSIAFTFLH